MKTYYAAGLPYSDELWHHGTKGMKWGQRLYQYEDGTLTPLGKIHYGVKKLAGRAVQSVKRRHTWMMTDDELEADIKRLKKEKELKDTYLAVKGKSVGKKFLEKTGDVAYTTAKGFGESFGKQAGTKIANGIIDKAIESDNSKRARELQEKALINNRMIEYRNSVDGLYRREMDKRISDLKLRKDIADKTKDYLVSKRTLDKYIKESKKN